MEVLLQPLWPDVMIRLDGMHALLRLISTTSSTQHPWHGTFCRKLSNAMYTADRGDMKRLRIAWRRENQDHDVPKNLITKCVRRRIVDAPRIMTAIQEVIDAYQDKSHSEAGSLLTPETQSAWICLQKHVRSGCLCDPPGIDIHACRALVSVGGEEIETMRPLRGASRLEGFHAHQKEWLGPRGRHATTAGEALLADGAMRWNRKTHNEMQRHLVYTPMVFRDRVLEEADNLHVRLAGRRLYPGIFAV